MYIYLYLYRYIYLYIEWERERERERPLTHSASICNYSAMDPGWRYVICGFYHPWQPRTMKVNSSHRWELIPLFIYIVIRHVARIRRIYSTVNVQWSHRFFSPGPEFIDPTVKWHPQVTVLHVLDWTVYELLHLKDLDSKKHGWGWVAQLQHVIKINTK